MKYRDLEIVFSIENVDFHTLSICLEKLDTPMPMHSHSKNSYEIHYISYGCGTLITSNDRYDITPGTLFVTGPKVMHEQISVPEDPMIEYCIYIKVDTESKAKKGSLADSFLRQDFWFGNGDNAFHELMKRLLIELENREIGYELAIQALLSQVILYLTRKYREADTVANAAQTFPSGRTADLTYLLIEEAFLYNYMDVTLDSLASQLNLGPRQTERLLKLHYNKTFQQKKTEARMSAACSLLRDTNKTISEIALLTGYSSVEHFSTAFKRYMGCTATEYSNRF